MRPSSPPIIALLQGKFCHSRRYQSGRDLEVGLSKNSPERNDKARFSLYSCLWLKFIFNNWQHFIKQQSAQLHPQTNDVLVSGGQRPEAPQQSPPLELHVNIDIYPSPPPPPPPSPPLNITCSEINKDSLTVNWDLPEDNSTVEKFIVQARDATRSNSEWVTKAETQNGRECSIRVNNATLNVLVC